jgi:hypothetical protein
VIYIYLDRIDRRLSAVSNRSRPEGRRRPNDRTSVAADMRDDRRRAMRFARCRRCASLLAARGVVPAEPIEIFDAHLHYNWEPKPYYQLDEVLALFKKHRVTGILATSRPNTGTHALMDAKAEACRSCPSSGRIASAPISRPGSAIPLFSIWCRTNSNAAITAASANSICRASRRKRVVKKIVDFAVANDLYLHAHADDEAVEILMRHNPKARIIWAHTGFGLSTDRVAAMLSKYPKLGAVVLPQRHHDGAAS